MNITILVAYAAALFILFLAESASAYVGPGAGLSLLGSLVGVVIAIFAILAGIMAWPIRRWLKRNKSKNLDLGKSASDES
jgi:membrane protein implicated in regulation of membrane protease activity